MTHAPSDVERARDVALRNLDALSVPGLGPWRLEPCSMRANSVYTVDRRPFDDPGWMHFIVIEALDSVGSSRYLAVRNETEELVWLGSTGE